MGDWTRVFDVLAGAAVAAVLIVLAWAARERGRIHRHLSRVVHRTLGLHVAAGAVASWV